MDKKMIVEAFKQLLKRNLAKDIKQAQNSKAPKLTGSLAKLNKPVKIANVAIKMTETLVAMNAVDALAIKMHQLLPKTTDGLEWLHALPSKIANSTIGQIPILGAVYRWINNAIAEGFAKLSEFLGNDALASEARKRKRVNPDEGFNASFDEEKHNLSGSRKEDKEGGKEMSNSNQSPKIGKGLVNHPSFYENLDLHKTFSIPGGYTKKTVVNGTLATPKLAVHRLCENPVPDLSALVDRLNQKFSLIKAVRGLSATNYTLIDLANYERYAKINLLQYYVIKKVVQAAKTYNLVQVQIGDNIITSLGFVPAEVRQNLANYETLLCQWHRFITNNIPMNGTWIQRLEYLVGANIPDYSDAKVATIHMFAVSMTDVYDGVSDEKYTFDCIPEAANNSYSVMLINFNKLQMAIVNNSKWQQLIADYFGAFGVKCMWSDKDYPAYANPINLANADSDLCREQVKNAFYLNTKVTIITVNAGVRNAKYVLDSDSTLAVQYPGYQFGNTYDAAVDATETTLSYNTLLDNDSYLQVSRYNESLTLGTNSFVLLPDMNGIGAQTVSCVNDTPNFVSMQNHETIYSLHKDGYTEGEALEISQFKCRSIGGVVSLKDTPDVFTMKFNFKTHEYAMLDTTVYVFGSNGTSVVAQTYVLCNESISDDDLTDVESPVNYPDEIMCWSLIDWMPFMHITAFSFVTADATYYPRDILMIDMDSFGSLDDRAFATSINYSIYSLQGANLKIDGQRKRISNLADVYQDKPSRRG